jgi:phosphatidylglycerophosphatase A
MSIQPQRTWIWSRPERALAFGFGSGLSIRAPGTVGTLYAWAFYLLFEILFTTQYVGGGRTSLIQGTTDMCEAGAHTNQIRENMGYLCDV